MPATPGTAEHPSLREAAAAPYWLDRPDRPEPRAPLDAHADSDLCIVGGGYSGLWTAILAKERDPSRDVVLLEGSRVGWAASGRNGGFCAASLTHGRANGAERFPDEIDRLDELGRENLDALEATLTRYDIACDFERPGAITVATEPHHVEWLHELAAESPGSRFLDRDAMRAEVASPTYLAGVHEPDDTALVDPARLAWGLAAAAESLGVRIHEQTAVSGISRSGAGLDVKTHAGHVVRARHVALGTNAFPSPVRRLRLVHGARLRLRPDDRAAQPRAARLGRLVRAAGARRHDQPVPLLPARPPTTGSCGAATTRSTTSGATSARRYDQRPATFELLARQFFETFPQLEGLRFSHRWGGAIDTCTRFCAFFGTAYGGRAAYALGYTGLGVGATRFGAEVMLDLLDGADTERTRLALVRSKPLPFPPEPFAWAGIELTRRSLAAADRHQGQRNLWLRSLDRLGLGFDS